MENIFPSPHNTTTGTASGDAFSFNQGAEILALLHQLQQGQITLREGQVILQQGQDALQEGLAILQQGQVVLQEEQTTLQEGQAEILQQVEGLKEEGSRQDKNSIARVINNSASLDGTPLEPFYGINGQLAPNFPATLGHAKRLRGDRVDTLLLALGLETGGTLAVRRTRVSRYIGLRDDE
ncbi:hypothetical protein HOY82DRAFT_484107 [Tuber indicum]|nr:hypothetical protein HOY82DRAFT_484107 [Tuber indicum]